LSCTFTAACAPFQSELDATKNELATQRIAFEEEKLARLNGGEGANESEAEALRIKLKQQVSYSPPAGVCRCMAARGCYVNTNNSF
jgi:hypothetical protein